MIARDVIQWQKRRTVGWLNLSLAARGAAEGIAVALDERGELRLGKYGLPGLAGPLGRPWAECEPAVLELLDAGRLVHDVGRGVLYDPQHLERVGGVSTPAREVIVQPEDVRPLTSTERSRATRDRKRRERLEATELQLELPTAAVQRDATLRSVASLQGIDAPPESGVMPVASQRTSERCNTVAPDSPSLSDLKISSKIRERGGSGATLRDVVQPDATLPDDCRSAFDEACARKDIALDVDFVWRKFRKHAHGKRWKLHEQLDRWVDWVDREIVWTLRQVEERDTRAKTGNAIALARARERDAERDQWDRDFERNLPEARAGAQRALAALGISA